MSIHTKLLDGSGSKVSAVTALFEYAKEVLGDSWSVTPAVESGTTVALAFTDSSGNQYEWQTNVANAGDTTLIYNGHSSSAGTGITNMMPTDKFTGMVWQGESGSVGVGIQNMSTGKYTTLYLLIKFDGIHANGVLYGMSAYGETPIIVHNDVDIASCNIIVPATDAAHVGVGVYLHPLYDPVSGLVSSDVFGAQSMESESLGAAGTIIKQGGTSYMAALGSSQYSYGHIVFVKM